MSLLLKDRFYGINYDKPLKTFLTFSLHMMKSHFETHCTKDIISLYFKVRKVRDFNFNMSPLGVHGS